MLLIFFLVATTMDTDKGLFRTLPAIPKEKTDIEVFEKNLFVVKVNKDDRLMVEKVPGKVEDLREQCVDFLLTMDNSEDTKYPEYEIKNIPLLGRQKVTKGIVSVQNDRGTSYAKYVAIQNEIIAAYNEVKDKYSQKFFKKPFAELDEDQQKAIKELIPQKISEAEPKAIGGN